MEGPFRIGPIATILLPLLALTASCSGGSGDAGPASHSFRTTDEAGIPVVINEGPPKYEQELFAYEPLLLLEEGDTEEGLFFRPGSFRTGSDGWYYVSDSGLHAVMVFDPSGRFHHKLGREGLGPGEFRYPSVTAVNGDTLEIYDSSARRITRYRRDGELIDVLSSPFSNMVRRRDDGFFMFPSRLARIGEDRLLAFLIGNKTGASGYFTKVGALMVSVRGDTLWVSESESLHTGEQVRLKMEGNEFETGMSYVYGPYLTAAYHPRLGIVAFETLEPEIHIYALTGELERIIRTGLPSDPVEEADRERVRAVYQRMIDEQEQEQSKEILEQQMKALLFADRKAPWSGVFLDEAGYIYLSQQDNYEDTSGPFPITYRVLSPEGEYLGSTEHPAGRSPWIVGSRLLINASDSEEGYYAYSVYTMKAAAPGFIYP